MAKKLTILIVDDENTLREVVRRYLDMDGFFVLEAESGTQALELLVEKPVDLDSARHHAARSGRLHGDTLAAQCA